MARWTVSGTVRRTARSSRHAAPASRTRRTRRRTSTRNPKTVRSHPAVERPMLDEPIDSCRMQVVGFGEHDLSRDRAGCWGRSSDPWCPRSDLRRPSHENLPGRPTTARQGHRPSPALVAQGPWATAGCVDGPCRDDSGRDPLRGWCGGQAGLVEALVGREVEAAPGNR